jgi:dihydrofolate reductase
MIRFIVAIDAKRGMANEHGIPWQGKTPTDVKYFRESTAESDVLMGLKTYEEFDRPLSNRKNYVAIDKGVQLKQGFNPVEDVDKFIKDHKGDLWIIGGAGIFAYTLKYADQLHITQLEGEFGATKFFPEFKQDFELASESEPHTENGITFRFQVWRRKS